MVQVPVEQHCFTDYIGGLVQTKDLAWSFLLWYQLIQIIDFSS